VEVYEWDNTYTEHEILYMARLETNAIDEWSLLSQLFPTLEIVEVYEWDNTHTEHEIDTFKTK
jgi:hypothetical protein